MGQAVKGCTGSSPQLHDLGVQAPRLCCTQLPLSRQQLVSLSG